MSVKVYFKACEYQNSPRYDNLDEGRQNQFQNTSIKKYIENFLKYLKIFFFKSIVDIKSRCNINQECVCVCVCFNGKFSAAVFTIIISSIQLFSHFT